MDYNHHLQQARSRTDMDRMVKAIGNDPKEFKKIVDIILKGKSPIQARAGWLIEIITRSKPELVKPHIKRFVDSIKKFENDSIKRSLFNALGKQKIPAKLQAQVLDCCYETMLYPGRAVAAKVFAMEVAKNIVLEYPELKGELKAVIEDQWERNSVAFRARGRMVLKQIK